MVPGSSRLWALWTAPFGCPVVPLVYAIAAGAKGSSARAGREASAPAQRRPQSQSGEPGATNPNAYYPFTIGGRFEGLITGDGKWKLHLPHGYRTLVTPGRDGQAGKYRQAKIDLSLFDMEKDPNETTNVIKKYPEVADRLKKLADQHRQRFFAKRKK